MRYRYCIIVLSLLVLASPAFAQGPGGYNPIGPGVDLAGNWGPVFHEDAHERGPGPELVNYLGLPITEGARMYGMWLIDYYTYFHIAREHMRLENWECAPTPGSFFRASPSCSFVTHSGSR